MINRRMLPLFLMSAMLGVACAEDSTGPDPDTELARFVGTWVATSFVLANLSNLSQEIDEIALGGAFTLTVSSDGRFTTDEVVPTDRVPRGMESGTIRITSGTTLDLTFEVSGGSGQTITISVLYQFSDSDRTLTLVTHGDDADFNGDGKSEGARRTLALVKS